MPTYMCTPTPSTHLQHYRMDSKGKVAQVAYPNVVFCIDNFEDIFSQIFTSKQGQKVAVQLLATNDVSRGKIIASSVV